VKILAVSDVELGFIYSPTVAQRFGDVDMIVACGDLPYYYMEFIISMLDKPLYYVRGNHASKLEEGSGGPRRAPWGAVDLHHKAIADERGVLLAGLEGCVRYNQGGYQYTQAQYWSMAFSLVPGLMANRAIHGRYLDVLVTHASPWKIHDMDDRPHQGVKAFNWLIKVFQPALHLHGHIHVYRNNIETETQVGKTRVINAYGYRELYLDVPTRPDYLYEPKRKARRYIDEMKREKKI